MTSSESYLNPLFGAALLPLTRGGLHRVWLLRGRLIVFVEHHFFRNLQRLLLTATGTLPHAASAKQGPGHSRSRMSLPLGGEDLRLEPAGRQVRT